jgi:hypothetical protein
MPPMVTDAGSTGIGNGTPVRTPSMPAGLVALFAGGEEIHDTASRRGMRGSIEASILVDRRGLAGSRTER